ncbi:MAG: hypothetical protein ABR529_08565 [Actinomycetota bacterium]
MAIEITDEAVEVLRRSLELGGIPADRGGIRLRVAHGLGGGADIQVELAAAPLSGESVIDSGGIKLFVDPAVTAAIPEAVVVVEPQHDIVVVRPAEPT